jgi:glycosyltransferase 2 family protein
LTPFFLLVTQFGGIIVLIVLACIYIVKKHYALVIRMFMAGLLADLLANIAKGFVGRPRPAEYFTDLVLRDPWVGGPGFPSGHTALATAAALVAWSYLPRKYRWIVPVWIIGVAVSRMYVGVHAPMDLVGGFAVGWFSVALFKHVSLRDIRK